MDISKFKSRDNAGFTLVEVLVAILVLALIAVAVSGISISFLMRVSDDAKDHQADATTAQWTSVKFARDVQGAAGIAPECAPGTGTRLLTLEQSANDPVSPPSVAERSVEYRVTRSGAKFGLIRVDCGAGGTTRTVVDDLDNEPSVTCDGGPCSEGSTPRVVTLHVARNSKFDFSLDGTRRTTDGNESWNNIPTQIPSFVSLGGSTMSLSGNGRLHVTGDAYINKPNSGNSAFNMSGNVDFNVTGNLLLQQGSTWNGSGNSGVSPTPGTFSTRFPDPLRFLPAPDASGLTVRTECPAISGVRVCQPGIYGDGHSGKAFPPDASGNEQFTLEPGTYIIRNGMSPSGNVSITSAGGVLLYIEKGSVNVSGNLKLNLTAPTSGIYAGILFFQARTNTSPFSISGNGAWTSLNGAIYAPSSSAMNLSSGNGDLRIPQLIGSNFSISGNGEVNVGG